MPIIIVLAVLFLVFIVSRRLGKRSGVSNFEIQKRLPGDQLIAGRKEIINRATTLPASAETVWPWILQLGKHRAGWYAPAWLEKLVVPNKAKRGSRVVLPKFQHPKIGDVHPDWGGGYLQVAEIIPNQAVVYLASHKNEQQPVPDGDFIFSWALTLEAIDDKTCHLLIRLQMRHPKRLLTKIFLSTFGAFFDYLTIVVLFAGLKERLLVNKSSS